MDAGADKVSLNSAALRDPALITELARLYGSQAVVVAIDAKRDRRRHRRSFEPQRHAPEPRDAVALGARGRRAAAPARSC